jgi:hypothetical protein
MGFKQWAVLAAIVAVAGVTATVVPATSQVPGQRTTLTLIDPVREGFEKEINEGSKRFGAGDWSVFRDAEFDPATCQRAATVQGRFTIVKRVGEQNAAFLVDGAALLPDGKITFYFAGTFADFESEEGLVGAITGGTGAYRDARGQISLTDGGRQCDKRVDLITVDLLLQ